MPKITLPESPATYVSRAKLEAAAAADVDVRHQILVRSANDFEWWVDFFGTVYEPRNVGTTEPEILPAFVSDWQRPYFRHLEDHYVRKMGILVEKTRDMRVTWSTLFWFFHKWRFSNRFSGLLGSWKQDFTDNGQPDSLFGKLDIIIEYLPAWMLPKGWDPKKHRKELTLINPENGSILSGESSNRNFSRSGRYSAIFFDEAAIWPDLEESLTAATQSTDCRIIVSTPKGQNAFYRLKESGKIDTYRMHWSMRPDRDLAWYEAQKAKMTDVQVAQELDISYTKSLSGVVYPLWQETIPSHIDYTPDLPLYIFMDFGIRDPTAMLWCQVKNDRLRIIDCFEKAGQAADYYIPFIKGEVPGNWPYTYSADEMEKIHLHYPWGPVNIFGDPAGKQRGQASGESIVSLYKQHGITLVTKESSKYWNNRYTATSLFLKGLEWNQERCQDLNKAMLNARYQEVNPDQDHGSSQMPIHDWTSHYRSALEYGCVNLRKQTLASFRRPEPTRTVRGYDRL